MTSEYAIGANGYIDIMNCETDKNGFHFIEAGDCFESVGDGSIKIYGEDCYCLVPDYAVERMILAGIDALKRASSRR